MNDGQYERIAEWLDLPAGGGRVELTAAERAAAEQIRRAEVELAARIAYDAPRAAMDRARRRMLAELARPGRRRVARFGYVAAVAAAAAIVLAVTLFRVFRGRGPERPQTPVALPNLPTDTLVAEALKSGSADLDLLAGEIDALEVDLLAAGWPVAADPAAGLDELEHEIDEFWMEHPPPDTPEG